MSDILSLLKDITKEELEQLIASRKTPCDFLPKTILIDEGLSIYKMQQSKYWWMRVRIDSKDHKFSTKEIGPEKARDVAVIKRAFLQGQLHSGALVSKSMTVSIISKDLVSEIKLSLKTTTAKDYVNIFEKQIIPQLGHLSIKKLDTKEINDFLISSPYKSKTRITLQRSCFKKLFEYSLLNRLIDRMPEIPSFKASQPPIKRYPFDANDLIYIYDSFDSFINSSIKSKTQILRSFLKPYFSFLITTGVRPGFEPLYIKWRDVFRSQNSHGNFYLVKTTKGKTGSRDVVLSKQAMISMTQAFLLNHYCPANDLNFDQIIKLHSEEYIFRPIGSQLSVPTYERIFGQLISHISSTRTLRYLYTLYSCRHSYINDNLSRGIEHSLIAKNCGNSVSTIEKYYEKYSSVLSAHRLIDLSELDENAKKLFGSPALSFDDFSAIVNESAALAIEKGIAG